MDTTYKVKDFAQLAGVTVRTLHYYDRIGLLRPERAISGYRLYRTQHLERLEQIVALRFLGLPLREIAEVVGRERRSLPDVLAAQRRMLQARRQQLDRALAAIQHAEQAIHAGQPTTTLLRRIIKEIEMQENADVMSRYYNEPAQAALAERRRQWNPAEQESVTAQWRALFADVRALQQTDPAQSAAQQLVKRWDELVASFTAGDPDLASGVNQAWADRANWPNAMQQQASEFFDPEVWSYIARARAAANP